MENWKPIIRFLENSPGYLSIHQLVVKLAIAICTNSLKGWSQWPRRRELKSPEKYKKYLLGVLSPNYYPKTRKILFLRAANYGDNLRQKVASKFAHFPTDFGAVYFQQIFDKIIPKNFDFLQFFF